MEECCVCHSYFDTEDLISTIDGLQICEFCFNSHFDPENPEAIYDFVD